MGGLAEEASAIKSDRAVIHKQHYDHNRATARNMPTIIPVNTLAQNEDPNCAGGESGGDQAGQRDHEDGQDLSKPSPP